MNEVTIVKTLPHLYPLHISEEEINMYATNFSIGALDYISKSFILNANEVKYSGLLNLFKNINDISQKKQLKFNELLEKPSSEVEFVKYKRTNQVESILDYSILGDLITIWPIGYKYPVKLEFFGEELERMYLWDHFTNRSLSDLPFLLLSKVLPSDSGVIEDVKINIVDKKGIANSPKRIIFTQKELEQHNSFLTSYKIKYEQSDFIYPSLYFSNIQAAEAEIKLLKSQEIEIYTTAKEKKLKSLGIKHFSTIPKIKSLPGLTPESISKLPAGFISSFYKIALLTSREISGAIQLRRETESRISNIKKLLRQFEGEIEIGDFVVHEDYGIAIYSGLDSEKIDGVYNDYVQLTFAYEDTLLVPLQQINKITKYIGTEGKDPQLTSLGKKRWSQLKNKVKKKVTLNAKELVKSLALRETSKAVPIPEGDSEEYNIFTELFPFTPTSDQIRATNEIINDLCKTTPMNRLLVGDVGFGKTEVVMRAIFKVVEAGGQVALLAPTTVLAAQHYVTLTERFQETNYSIELVSRYNSTSKNKKLIDNVNAGKIDVLIGTHRILSSDVKFKDLQLAVIDEEQKFGVKQKEKLKSVSYRTHILSVSATPIPRTLSMALSSIQDISIITEPPFGRKAIKTEIIHNSFEKAVKGIQKELERGGQVYFIHNEVRTIDAITNKLKNYLPQIKIDYAHGQLSSKELQRKMRDFRDRKYEVLVATSIIENGLDLHNVNTIIIHNAHKFGLSQLYQMRGRVGRSDIQAYCYLMAPRPNFKISTRNTETIKELKKRNVKKQYIQRLQSLVENQDLGAGFRISSKDLELRGAGDYLGAKQHGHVTEVGYAMYIEMLAKEIERLKNSFEELPT